MSTAIPAGWSEHMLGDVAVILDNLRVPLSAAQREGRSGPFPYCGANGVLDYIDDFMIDDDVVLLAEDGGNFDQWRTRPIAYRRKGKIWVNNHAHVLKAAKSRDTGFLFYALEHKDITPFISSGTRSKLTRGELVRIRVLMPGRADEQREIASRVKGADDLIAALERMIAKKEAIKQGMMQQLLTGKTRLPGFLEPWSEGTFEQLAAPSKERAMSQEVLPDTPLVELEQIESGTGRLVGLSRASEAVSLKAVFNPGDVLFGKLRAYLRKFWYADVSGLCTTEIWVLRARSGVNGRFVRYIVETDEFIDVASGAYGTHMPRSDWGTVRNIPVLIPPLDEQIAMASVFAEMDNEIDLLKRRLTKARAVKQGMMQELLTGRARLPVEETAT